MGALVLTSLTFAVTEAYDKSVQEIFDLIGADVQVMVLLGELGQVQCSFALDKRSLLKVFLLRLSLCGSAELLLDCAGNKGMNDGL